jgi:hypothetical protein
VRIASNARHIIYGALSIGARRAPETGLARMFALPRQHREFEMRFA